VLRQERQAELDRERAMRQTILSQDDQVRYLAAETARLNSEVLSMDQLVTEVRHVVGLDRLAAGAQPSSTLTVTQILTPAVILPMPESGVAAVGSSVPPQPNSVWGSEDRAVTAVSGRGASSLTPSLRQQAASAAPSLTDRLTDLRLLRDTVRERLARVDAADQSSPASIEKALALYDAAPKLAPLTVPFNITSRFGMRPDPVTPWFSAMHFGVDLSAWYSTPVYATKAGKVVFAGWNGNLGYTVEIQHEMGYKTIYGHNKDLQVVYGEFVVAGELIAHAGDTGRTTGPHVHYEIELNGTALDPLKFMAMPVQGGAGVQSQR
jgi:murein DD-endopeptidase MepM/ murein hydrolase activator NlpD